MPSYTEDIAFQRISSPLGNSPFDKGLANRDKIVSGYVNIINKAPITLPLVTEIQDEGKAVFPGLGSFGPGGGPDTLDA